MCEQLFTVARVTGDRGESDDRTGKGVSYALASSASNQLGAAMGSLAFPVLGPAGVVAVRQLVAATVLLFIARPRILSFTRAQWVPVIGLAVALAVMNLSLYFAIQRIGLGLAVALEFLGPLCVALFTARSRAGIVAGIVAAAGVLAVTHPDGSSDWPGISLALLAALCWASYILLNRTIGHRLSGLQGTAAATALSAAVFLPVGIWIFLRTSPDPATILYAVGAGVFASAIPFAFDLMALRHLRTSLFGVISSIQPVSAAIAGALILRQSLIPLEWLGILLIAAANVLVLTWCGRRSV